jgi:cytochrome c556
MSNRIPKKKKLTKVVKKLSKSCQKIVKIVKGVKTFNPAKQKKSQKVVKKLSKYWQHRPKSSVSKTATMSAPQKNVTFCHGFTT